MARLATLLLLLATGGYAGAYYLPGTYPQEFYLGQTIQGAPRDVLLGSACSMLCARLLVSCIDLTKAGRAACIRATHPALPTGPAWFPSCQAVRHAAAIDTQLGLTTAEVNSLVSSDSELPFDYYSMPFCKPPEGVKKSLSSVNPGTILTGSRILNSPYNFTVLVRDSVLSLVEMARRSTPAATNCSVRCARRSTRRPSRCASLTATMAR